MASKRTLEQVKELVCRGAEIMAREFYMALPDEEQGAEIGHRLSEIDRALRRLCMEADVPVIELVSEAGPDDPGFNAGHYFMVTRRSNEEVAAVRTWWARRHESEIDVEFEDGTVSSWREWDPEIELVEAEEPESRPECD